MRTPRGYTLVELLVALVLTGIIAGSVLGFLLEQDRFYGTSSDLVYAEQSLRAGMDLLSSELQMASPTDLIVAEDDSVSVRFDVWRGVVCGTASALDEASVFLYDSVTNANLPASFRGYSYSNPLTSDIYYADGWSPSVDLSVGQVECENNGAPTGQESWRYRVLTGWTGAGGFGQLPERGAWVTKYGQLTYHFAPSGFDPGAALWRNGQEVVSPFRAGAAFSYVMADSSVRSSVAASKLDSVRAIRVSAVALGPDDNRYDVEREFQFDVWLQN